MYTVTVSKSIPGIINISTITYPGKCYQNRNRLDILRNVLFGRISANKNVQKCFADISRQKMRIDLNPWPSLHKRKSHLPSNLDYKRSRIREYLQQVIVKLAALLILILPLFLSYSCSYSLSLSFSLLSSYSYLPVLVLFIIPNHTVIHANLQQVS